MTSRGQRLYDWWSQHPTAFRLLYGVAFLGRERQLRERSLAGLDLQSGETVLEVGCGRGNSLAALADRVGPTGRVIGVDFSQRMVETARDRIAREGVTNASVVRADATRLPLAADSVDAAYASMSLTATTDARRAAGETARVLRSGGRFGLLDARPFQRPGWRLLNPIVVPVARVLTDWHPETDPVHALRAAFDDVTVEADTGGSILVALARTD